MIARRVVRGQTLSFPSRSGYRHEARGAVAIGRDGRILWTGAYRRLPAIYRRVPVDDYGDCLVMPGLIDAHIHFPQYRMLAAPGIDLLDWLPASRSPRKPVSGTDPTPTAPPGSFSISCSPTGPPPRSPSAPSTRRAPRRCFGPRRRATWRYTGKTMMDRNAVPAVHDAPEQGARDSEKLLVKWHGRGRARYAVTPRFAITSSEAQLRLSGELLKSHPEALLQSYSTKARSRLQR